MVLRIFKVIATSSFSTALECTKFVLGQGSARTPLGELTSLPNPPAGALILKRDGEAMKKGKEEGKGRGNEDETPPLRKFLDPP